MEENKELISVIVPVYQVEKYLVRCLESVVNQTYKNLEIILVDDGSTDASGEICDEYAEKDDRIKVIHKENGGLSSARNAGLDIAQGEYIAFVDSDDWIAPDMYQCLYQLLILHPECQIAECGVIRATDNSKCLVHHLHKYTVLDKDGMFNYFFRVKGEASNTGVWKYLIRREILSGFSFVITLNEDVEANYEFFNRATHMIRTNQKYYYYYVNKSGITKSQFSEKDLDYLKVWDRILERTRKENSEYEKLAEFYRSRANYTMLAKMKLNGYNRNNNNLVNVHIQLKKEIRKDFLKLLSGNISISRKILLIYLLL